MNDAEKSFDVVYICDRKACGNECPSLSRDGDPCEHTNDIEHAVNFIEVGPGKFAEINDRVLNFLSAKE